MHAHQRQMAQAFRSLLPVQSKVLFLQSPLEEPALQNETIQWLEAHGCEVEAVPHSKDLRFLSPAKESYDGAWCGESLIRYSIEDVQRVLAILFKSLKPKAGAIALQYLRQHDETSAPQGCFQFPEPGFASLLRQNGYQIQTQGHRQDWVAILAKRI